MTITDELNRIEARTKELALAAQSLEVEKSAYEGLLECEVHDHHWRLEEVGSNLRYVQTIEIICERCGCYTIYTVGIGGEIPIANPNEVFLRDILPEEDE